MELILLSDEQTQSILDLRKLWPREHVVLIGGMALDHIGALDHRPTQDLDLAVAIATERVEPELLSVGGWSRDPLLPHRWRSPLGVIVDILPIGASVLEAGRIEWVDGSSMNALGFRHLLTQTSTVPLQEGMEISVARPALIAFLKIVAFQDRPADRSRDLADLAHMLEHRANDPRMFSEPVLRSGIPEDLVGAFLLGADLRVFLDAAEQACALAFVDRVLSHDDGGVTEVRMTRVGPRSWREEPDRIRHLMSRARKIADGVALAALSGHVRRACPPGAPVLPQPGLQVPLRAGPLLALGPGRLLPPPGRTPPHPAFPL